jgi:hypothetical protein
MCLARMEALTLLGTGRRILLISKSNPKNLVLESCEEDLEKDYNGGLLEMFLVLWVHGINDMDSSVGIFYSVVESRRKESRVRKCSRICENSLNQYQSK